MSVFMLGYSRASLRVACVPFSKGGMWKHILCWGIRSPWTQPIVLCCREIVFFLRLFGMECL